MEREMLVLGTQLHRVGDTFMMLAKVLRDEREAGTPGVYEGRESLEECSKTRSDVPLLAASPFEEGS